MLTFGDNIKRLEQAKADIKEAIEQKGVVVGDGLINTYADKILEIKEAGELETVDVTITENGSVTTLKPSGDNVGIEKATIYANIPMQYNKEVLIDRNGEYTVYVDNGYEGMKNVNIDVDIPIDGVQNLTVTENNTYYTIKPSGENIAIESAVVYTDIPMQEKTVDVTSNGTLTISPDDGYEGLNTVNLNVAVKGDGKTVLPNGICLSGSTWETFDATQYDWSKVRSFNSMFNSCRNLTTINGIEDFDTSKVTTMSSMFNNCKNLTSLDLSSWDTSKVTDMYMMFYKCSNLTSLDLSSWDTSKVTKMLWMFHSCSNLTSLDLSNFDTSNVMDMGYMFNGCSNLTSLDLSNWDTSKVTTMYLMFRDCNNLTTINGIEGFDTSKVTNMGSMFHSCSKLTSLDLSNWDTSNVTDMSYMFRNCSNLTELKMGGDVSNVTKVSDMFMYVYTTGTFYYNPQYDYSKIIAVLPSTWTAVPME